MIQEVRNRYLIKQVTIKLGIWTDESMKINIYIYVYTVLNYKIKFFFWNQTDCLRESEIVVSLLCF